jgi:small subunit ribosomal protein S17
MNDFCNHTPRRLAFLFVLPYALLLIFVTHCQRMLSLVSKRLVSSAANTVGIASFNNTLCRSSSVLNTLRFQSTTASTPSSSSSSVNSQNLEEEYKTEIADILTDYENRMKRRQAKIGTVVSTKNAKTISVEIEYQRYFPKYDTYLRRTRKIMAHDEEEKASKGDVVRIVPCRPRSAMKRHALIDVIRKHAASVDEVPASTEESK